MFKIKARVCLVFYTWESHTFPSREFEARPCFLEALREQSGSQLNVGAKKKIRHLSALFEGCNRNEESEQGREPAFFFASDRQLRVSPYDC